MSAYTQLIEEGETKGDVRGLNKSRQIFKALQAGQKPEAIAEKLQVSLQEVLDSKEVFGL